MKKTSKILLLIAAMAMIVTVLSACNFINAGTITIVQYPATTYVVGEELDTDSVKIKIGEIEYTLTDALALGVELKNFDTSKVGNYTATIEYAGYQATFTYSVIEADTGFAGGNGTQLNPYQISTLAQFEKFRKQAPKQMTYFELINDIDLAKIIEKNSGSWNTNISLNGNGYKLFNIKYNLFIGYMAYDNSKKEKLTGIFENIDFYFDSTTDCSPIQRLSSGNLIYRNCNTYGKVVWNTNNQNMGLFIANMNKSTNITFENCNNYAKILGTCKYGAVYIGGSLINSSSQYNVLSTATFKNCHNYADIEGTNIAFLIGNTSRLNEAKVYIDSETKNHGTITGAVCASDFAVTNNNKMTLAEAIKNGIVLDSNGAAFEGTLTDSANINELTTSATFSGALNGSFTFTADTTAENAYTYELAVTYWGNVEGASLTDTFLLYKSDRKNAADMATLLNSLKANKWQRGNNGNAIGSNVQPVAEDSVYKFNDATESYKIASDDVLNVTYWLYVYDGTELVGCKYIEVK